jgi:hypothetical protein
MAADDYLCEVVLERGGRVLAAYRVRRDVRGAWELLPADPGAAGDALPRRPAQHNVQPGDHGVSGPPRRA